MWPFKKKKPPISTPSNTDCNHKYREFDWYKETNLSVTGYRSGEEIGYLTIRIYKPYVCIHCKHRKDVLLKEITRIDTTWEEALKEDKQILETYADKLRPRPEVEEAVADFQLIDREYLKHAQALFPDRDILKEDPDA